VNHTILKFLDSCSGVVRALFIDFEKAFDKLPHNILINHMARLGASKEFIIWLFDYLQRRFQCVSQGNKTSGWLRVLSGVPQGSILGPVLFAAVIDALKCIQENSIPTKFADDLSILHMIRTLEEDHLSDELRHVINWATKNGLNVNMKKTKEMIFCTKRSLVDKLRPVAVADYVVENVTEFKLLGVTLQSNFSWNTHVANVCRTAHQRLYGLRQLRSLVDKSAALWEIYRAFVRSVLVYAYPAICNMSAGLFARLKYVEKRASQIIGGTPSQPIEDFCQAQCRKMAVSLGLSDHKLHSMLHVVDKGRQLRHKTQSIPFAKTTRFKNSFIKYL
jgi:hypothetical protein